MNLRTPTVKKNYRYDPLKKNNGLKNDNKLKNEGEIENINEPLSIIYMKKYKKNDKIIIPVLEDDNSITLFSSDNINPNHFIEGNKIDDSFMMSIPRHLYCELSTCNPDLVVKTMPYNLTNRGPNEYYINPQVKNLSGYIKKGNAIAKLRFYKISDVKKVTSFLVDGIITNYTIGYNKSNFKRESIKVILNTSQLEPEPESESELEETNKVIIEKEKIEGNNPINNFAIKSKDTVLVNGR